MEIKAIINDNEMIIDVRGRIDTNTSPELEDFFEQHEQDIPGKLVFDFEHVEYISSAGLRVLLMYYKMCGERKKDMFLRHLSPEIYEVFQITGFSDFLNIMP